MRAKYSRLLASIAFALGALSAQDPNPVQVPAPPERPAEAPAGEPTFSLEPGTRVPLSLINTVSTRNASPGDRVYLESVFPILAGGRIVVPPGSYVAGTVTQVKRPGRVKGKGELFVRFDSLTLPNGVTRDFRATIGALDGSQPGKLDPKEGKVTGDSSKGKDARTIGQTTQAGAGVGALGGWAGGRTGMGLGIGSAAGAAAGLMAVLLTRGDDAMLAKGTTVEMILDRQLTYTEAELAFNVPARGTPTNGGGQSAGTRLPLSRVPENQ